MVINFVSGHLDLTAGSSTSTIGRRWTPPWHAGRVSSSGTPAGRTPSPCTTCWTRPRNNAGFPTLGGFASDADRDAAMTAASRSDAAWVRPGREKSGTQKNIDRRQRLDLIKAV